MIRNKELKLREVGGLEKRKKWISTIYGFLKIHVKVPAKKKRDRFLIN